MTGLKKNKLTMLLQLLQPRERNAAIEIIQFCLLFQKKKKKRYVPMRLTIRTLENQAVPNVHPGTSIQQPIYSEKKVISELILGRRRKKKVIRSQTKETVAK